MSLLNQIKSFFHVSNPKAAWDYDDIYDRLTEVKNQYKFEGAYNMGAFIENTGGKAVLKNARTGDVISVYSRERDARRGALRRGLSIVA
jgi:hypothetical protein